MDRQPPQMPSHACVISGTGSEDINPHQRRTRLLED